MRTLFDQLKPLSPLKTKTRAKLAPCKNIKAILFDVYGTLLVSASGDIGAMGLMDRHASAALKTCGVLPRQGISMAKVGKAALTAYRVAIDKDHFNKKMRGIAFPEVEIRNVWTDVLLALVTQKLVRPASIKPVDVRDLAMTFEFKTNPVYPMPAFKESLAELSGAGYRLGIVSNAQFFTPMLMRYFLGQKNLDGRSIEHFDKNLCEFSYEDGFAKPGPVLYERMAKRLKRYGLKPQQCLYIGNDMLNDIYPAQQLGFQTVLFAADERSLRWRESHPVLGSGDVKPDRIVTHLNQIQRLVK